MNSRVFDIKGMACAVCAGNFEIILFRRQSLLIVLDGSTRYPLIQREQLACDIPLGYCDLFFRF
jgi:hypothetical protein